MDARRSLRLSCVPTRANRPKKADFNVGDDQSKRRPYLVDAVRDSLLEMGHGNTSSELDEVSLFPPTKADIAFRFRSRVSTSLGDDLTFTSNGLIKQTEQVGDYLNVWLSSSGLYELVVENVREGLTEYGFTNALVNQVYYVEHTSINPVYPINIASFRSSAIGNALDGFLSANGAMVNTRFWVADLARHLEATLVGIASLGWHVEDVTLWPGKPDHNLGAIFAHTIFQMKDSPYLGDLSILRTMFPHAGIISILSPTLVQSKLSESLRLDDVSRKAIVESCTNGFKETLAACGINIDEFDYESAPESIELVEQIVDWAGKHQVPSSEAIALLRSVQLPEGNYFTRSAAYYLGWLRQHKNLISVVPLRQRTVLDESTSLAKMVNGSDQRSELSLYYFGDVTVGEAGIDGISEGRFSSVDGLIENHAEQLRVDQEVIAESIKFRLLKTRPTRHIHLESNPFEIHRDFLRFLRMFEGPGVRESLSSEGSESMELGYQERLLLRQIADFPRIIRQSLVDREFQRIADFAVRLDRQARLMTTRDTHLRQTLRQSASVVLSNALRSLGITLGEYGDRS